MRTLKLRLLPTFLTALALLAFTAAASQAATGHDGHHNTSKTLTSSSTSASKAKPKPAAKPIKARNTRATLSGLFEVQQVAVSVPHRKVHVKIRVWPYVKDQPVTIKATIGGKAFQTRTVFMKRSGTGKSAYVGTSVVAPHAGKVWITVSHEQSKHLKRFKIKKWYRALDTQARIGTKGKFVTLMQERMQKLHMFVQVTGVFDQQTAWALDAYHRLVGRGVTRTFDSKIISDLLDGKGTFHIRYPDQGRHAEGDLTDQLLALAVGKKVVWILPISSGKESTPTVIGSWQIYRRQPLYTSDGMYYSDFFTGGYAIHGYDPAPDYPASHGCMRLWDDDAIPVYNWLAIGDWVDSYGNPPFYLGEGDL